MSWSGTVRCSHCWNDGHNKRSCPDLAALLERGAAEGDEYAKERLIRSQSKKCTYCCNSYHVDDDRKHNARTCAWRIKYEQEVVTKTITRRHQIYDRMQTAGLNPGALLQLEEQSWNHDTSAYEMIEQLAVVESIHWPSITSKTIVDLDRAYDAAPIFTGKWIGGSRHNTHCHESIPVDVIDIDGVLAAQKMDGDYDTELQKNIRARNHNCLVVGPVFKDHKGHPPAASVTFKKVAKEQEIKEMVARKSGSTYRPLDVNGPKE